MVEFHKITKSQFFTALVIVAAVLALFTAWSFIPTILFAAFAAYLAYPIHKWMLKNRVNKNVSALLISVGFLAAVITLIRYVGQFILEESAKLYVSLSQYLTTAGGDFAFTISDLIRLSFSEMLEIISRQAATLPHLLLAFLIFFMAIFYFLRDGDKAVKYIYKTMPIPVKKKSVLFKEVTNYMDAFIYVQFVIAILQAFIGALGFVLFGLPYPFVAGIVMGILSFIPIIGPYAIYVPIAIIALINGDYATGVGLLGYGLVIMGALDYVLRPQMMGEKIRLHPLIVLVGILGGLEFMGAIGVLVGPIILSIFLATLRMAGTD